MTRTTELLDSVRGASLMTPEPFRSDIFKMLDELDAIRDADQERKDAIARIEELETRLRDIGDIAHAQSTGPAEPDWLWTVRELAYELL